MTETTNYKLRKPEPNENYDVGDFNRNVDIIDSELKEREDGEVALEAALTSHAQRITQNETDITDLETSKADKILTGYTNPSTGGALAPTDTVNEALGKLEANLDAAEADIAALDAGKAETATYTITLTAAGWQGAAAPYTQTVAVAGILVTDTPHYTAVYSGTNDQKIAQQEAWSMVSEDSTANGSITFVCFEDKPEVDLALQLEVIR